MGADRPTLRALLWCSATALQLLARTKAIACKLRLVAKHHSNAEPVKPILMEHQPGMARWINRQGIIMNQINRLRSARWVMDFGIILEIDRNRTSAKRAGLKTRHKKASSHKEKNRD